jgi:hypothetical protein
VSRQLDLSRLAPRLVLAATVAFIVSFAALLARVGSDARWLAALGHVILTRHAVPDGVPFATAPTGHWPNPVVLAELIFNGLEQSLGDRGLMLGQLAAVAAGIWILARDARAEGADEIGTSAALLIAALGCLTSLAVVRVQLFSLVLFPALIALLRGQVRRPSRAIWLAVPLLALWSNLHGAALLGWGVLLAYLIFERGRREPLVALGVAAGSTLALCLTPALARTVAYYHGVLTNVAAARGEGMWGPLSLSAPLDLLMLVAAAALGYHAWRGRARLWEWCVVAALVILTVKADRDGIWLLFFQVAPAARSLAPARALRALAPIAATVSVAALCFAVGRGPALDGASPSLVRGAIALAHGSPVLADGSIDEQIALDGGRIWAGDPIDAFSHPVQSAYLSWVAGDAAGRSALAPDVRVVLVSRGSQTQRLMARTPGFAAVGGDPAVAMYERVG